MTQLFLPFQYFSEKNEPGLTSLAGLPLYYDLLVATDLLTSMQKTCRFKRRGWRDAQIIQSLLLLNIAGGDCVEDIERLEQDSALRQIMLKADTHGMRRTQRRAFVTRWRKKKQRAFPSPSAIRRYLESCHDAAQEENREVGKAFIPAPNQRLESLLGLNKTLIAFAQTQQPCEVATLDQDATVVATHKRSARYSYKKCQAYQPFNTYWHEQKLLLNSEFRDGNVPAGFEQCRQL